MYKSVNRNSKNVNFAVCKIGKMHCYVKCTKNYDCAIGLITQKGFFVIDTDEFPSPPTYACIFSFQ